MKCNIYIANHGKCDGIEDFLTILTSVVQRHGHEVEVSEELKTDAINFVIDEFTNVLSNREILKFRRRNPSAKLVYVLTEFIEHRWFVTSFNFFKGPMEAALIAALSVYMRLRRGDFVAPRTKDWLLAIAYSPLLLMYGLTHLFNNFIRPRNMRTPLTKRIYRTAYMLMRYLGLERMLGCADCIILSHDLIAPGLKYISNDVPVVGTIHPEIDFDEIKHSLFKDKELFIEITGSVTPYREKFINEINSNILTLGLKNQIKKCESIAFESAGNGARRGAYSLHPPQTKQWKYASPTRIFRALQYDHNMPVLTKVFGQHPIEKLCLRYKGERTLFELYQYYKHPEQLINRLEPLAEEYMKVASLENEAVIKAVFGKRGTQN